MSNYNARVFVAQTSAGTPAFDLAGNPIAYLAEPGYIYVTGVNPPESYMIARGWFRATPAQIAAVSQDCTPIVPSTQPFFNSPTPDWTITSTGTKVKILESNEFTLVLGVNYTFQAFAVLGPNALTNLPGWLSFNAGSRTFTAVIPSGMTNPDITIRVVVSDPSGSNAVDEFKITVNLPAGQEPGLNAYTSGKHYEIGSITPLDAYRVIDSAHSSPLTQSEGTSRQYVVEQQYSDNSWQATTRPSQWYTTSGIAGALSVSSTGLLTVAANSISSNEVIILNAVFTDDSRNINTQITITNQPAN